MAILEEPIKGVPMVKNYINGEWVESKGKNRKVSNNHPQIIKEKIIELCLRLQ